MDSETPAVQPPATPGYPVRVDLVAPNKIARWRPFLHFLMAIPHFLIGRALQALSGVTTLIAFFVIVFTKKYPDGLFKISVLSARYNWRVMSFALYLREPYPPFEFPAEPEDDGSDPARLSIEYPGELSRWLPFVKFFLAIPHFVVLVFLGIGAFFVWFLSFFAVLFTGRYPEGMRSYMVGVIRWAQRVTAYVGLMTDRYPPFSLQ